MEIVKTLIKDIQRSFSSGCPNGMLLGWDPDRFAEPIGAIFESLEVSNNTDFNYSYCNSYEISLSPERKKNCIVITLKISFISNVYLAQAAAYSADRRSGRAVNVAEQLEFFQELEKARLFLASQGFLEVPEEILNMIVEGVELELSPLATIEKCLFDDFE